MFELFKRRKDSGIGSEGKSQGHKQTDLQFYQRYNQQRKRAIKISDDGSIYEINFDKHALGQDFNIPFRDFKYIDPWVAIPYSIALFIRERAVIVNFGVVRLIISSDQVIVLSLASEIDGEPEEPKATSPFIVTLSNRLKQGSKTWRKAEQLRRDLHIDLELPFEMKALEMALAEVTGHMDSQTGLLENDAWPALDRLATKVNATKLEEVREIKTEMAALLTRVNKLQYTIEDILEDDIDMLSLVMNSPDLCSTPPAHSPSAIISAFSAPHHIPATTARPGTGHVEHAISSHPPTTTSPRVSTSTLHPPDLSITASHEPPHRLPTSSRLGQPTDHPQKVAFHPTAQRTDPAPQTSTHHSFPSLGQSARPDPSLDYEAWHTQLEQQRQTMLHQATTKRGTTMKRGKDGGGTVADGTSPLPQRPGFGSVDQDSLGRASSLLDGGAKRGLGRNRRGAQVGATSRAPWSSENEQQRQGVGTVGGGEHGRVLKRQKSVGTILKWLRPPMVGGQRQRGHPDGPLLPIAQDHGDTQGGEQQVSASQVAGKGSTSGSEMMQTSLWGSQPSAPAQSSGAKPGSMAHVFHNVRVPASAGMSTRQDVSGERGSTEEEGSISQREVACSSMVQLEQREEGPRQAGDAHARGLGDGSHGEEHVQRWQSDGGTGQEASRCAVSQGVGQDTQATPFAAASGVIAGGGLTQEAGGQPIGADRVRGQGSQRNNDGASSQVDESGGTEQQQAQGQPPSSLQSLWHTVQEPAPSTPHDDTGSTGLPLVARSTTSGTATTSTSFPTPSAATGGILASSYRTSEKPPLRVRIQTSPSTPAGVGPVSKKSWKKDRLGSKRSVSGRQYSGRSDRGWRVGGLARTRYSSLEGKTLRDRGKTRGRGLQMYNSDLGVRDKRKAGRHTDAFGTQRRRVGAGVPRQVGDGGGEGGFMGFTEQDARLIEAVEAVLEAYFMQIDFTRSRLLALKERIDDTEDLIQIDLDQRRNELEALGLVVTTITFIFGFVSMVGGVFGMNLSSGVESSTGLFWTVAGASLSLAFFMGLCFFMYVRSRGLMFIPDAQNYSGKKTL